MKIIKIIFILITIFSVNLFAFEELTKHNFMEKTDKGNIILDFYAPGCPPCSTLDENLKKIKEYADKNGIKIYKVNSIEQPEVSQALKVQATPTIYYIKDGKGVGVVLGAAPVERLKQDIKKYFK